MPERHLRRVRWQIAYAIGNFAAGIGVYLVRDLLAHYLTPLALTGVTLIFITGGVVTLLLLYLRGDISTLLDRYIVPIDRTRDASEINRKLFEDVRSLSERMAELRRDMTVANTTGTVDPDTIVERLRSDIIDRILAEVERKYSAKLLETAHVSLMRSNLSDTSVRLRQEIAALTRRGNLNLVIGSVTTALAVGLLAYMVLGAEVKFTDLTNLLSHYIPRITTVAFIEVFAFFFLKLYRSTLDEIKYYQNELTNTSVLAIGVEASLITDDQQSRAKLFEQLVVTDRNATARSASKADHGLNSKDLTSLLEQLAKVIAETAKSRS